MITPVKKKGRRLIAASPVKKKLRTKLLASPIAQRKKTIDISSDTEESAKPKIQKATGSNKHTSMANPVAQVLITSGSDTDFSSDDYVVETNNSQLAIREDGLCAGNMNKCAAMYPDDEDVESSDSGLKKKPSVLYRSNLNSAMKELGVLKFLPQHLQLMRMTPFNPLFESLIAPRTAQKLRMCKKKDICIQKIINSYSATHDAFMLGDQPVKLSEADFSLILGVCEGSRNIERRLKKGYHPKWLLRCFGSEIAASKRNGGSFVMERAAIYRKIVGKISSTETSDVEDVVKLVNCYILTAVLMTKQNGNMRTDLAQLFEKLDETSLYDWSGLFVDFLISQIKAKTKMVGGCAVILPYFAFEHTNMLEAKQPDLFPRYLKWDMSQGNKELQTVKIKNLKGVRTKILPTGAERLAMASIVAHHEKMRGKSKVSKGVSTSLAPKLVATKREPEAGRRGRFVKTELTDGESADSSDAGVSSPGETQEMHNVNSQQGVAAVNSMDFVPEADFKVDRPTSPDAPDIDIVPDSDGNVEDDILVQSTYDIESSPVYNYPVVRMLVDNEECNDATVNEDACPDLAMKMRLVDLNDPVFVTPRQINYANLANAETDAGPSVGFIPDPFPRFDLGAEDSSELHVTSTQVERYMGGTNLVEHLETVTLDNTRLTDEILELRSLLESAKKTIIQRDNQVAALTSIVAANRELVDNEVQELRKQIEMLNMCAERERASQCSIESRLLVSGEETASLLADNEKLNRELSDIREQNEHLTAHLKDCRSETMNIRAAFEELHVQIKVMTDANANLAGKVRTEHETMVKKFTKLMEENSLKADRRMDAKDNELTQKIHLVETLKRDLELKDAEVTSLAEKVNKLEDQVVVGRTELENVRAELQVYTEPTDTQLFFENPYVLQLTDKVVELHQVSNQKLELERNKEVSDVTLAEQKELIGKLANITNSLRGTVTPQTSLKATSSVSRGTSSHSDGKTDGLVTPNNMFSTFGPVCEGVQPISIAPYPEIICIDDDGGDTEHVVDRGEAGPSSMTKRVKTRTTENGRAPKNLSPFAVYGAGVVAVRGGGQRLVKPEPRDNQTTLNLDEKFPAINKTPAANRAFILTSWDENGPEHVIYRGDVPMSDVKLKELVRVLRHERVSISITNAYPDLVLKELTRRGRGSKTHIFTARFLGFLRGTVSPNRQKFFQEFFTKLMPSILEAEILLFPINPIFGDQKAPAKRLNGPEPTSPPDEWLLLKYVRVSAEWHIFNPRINEAGFGLDACKEDVNHLIGYVESSMTLHLCKHGGSNPILKRNQAGKPIQKKCPQAMPGKPETAAIVINVMEKCIKRDNNLPPQFTEEMSACFRSKIAQCLTSDGERLPI